MSVSRKPGCTPKGSGPVAQSARNASHVLGRTIPALAALMSACAAQASAPSQPAHASGPGSYAIVGATLFDGINETAVPNATIIVHDGRIVSVASGAKPPRKTPVHDARGKWITPGLVDAHVHIWESGRLSTMPVAYDVTAVIPYPEEVKWIQARVRYTLSRYTCSGVTSFLSVGGPKLEFEARDLAKSDPTLPTVYVALGPISAVPSEMIFPPFNGDQQIYPARTEADIDALLDEAQRRGADFIKSGLLGGPFTPMEEGLRKLFPYIVGKAHQRGLNVTSHVTTLEDTKSLILAGSDSIQHLPLDLPVDSELIDLARARGTIFVPTLIVYERAGQVADRSFTLEPIEEECGDRAVLASWRDPQLTATSQRVVPRPSADLAGANALRLSQAGLDLAVGSDAGNIGLLHGASIHRELALLQQAGIRPASLIRAATHNSAKVAGKASEVGSIRPGMQADILILSADPALDIRNLQKIDAVIVRGNIMTTGAIKEITNATPTEGSVAD